MSDTSHTSYSPSLFSDVHLLIPASGIGARFGGTIPKQYTKMSNGLTILDTTISGLLSLGFKSITVAISEMDMWWQESIHTDVVRSVQGGKKRYDSVLSGVEHIISTYDAKHLVAVHDGVRPLIDHDSIANLIHTIKESEYVGGLLVAPMQDSIKLIKGGELSHYSREQVFRALTPQIYSLEVLRDAISYCIQRTIPITDDASAVEALGHQSCYEVSTKPNIKITTKVDLEIVTTLLGHDTHIT